MILFCFSSLFAQDKHYYFYNPANTFGSDLMFNPVTLFFNGSFDILRNGGMSKNVWQQPYRAGFENLFDNLLHPAANVQKYGTRSFFSNEVLNLSFNPDKMQYLPNYTLHLIGNSMQWVKLAEWYEHHGYPYPQLLSLATTLTYQLFNEAVENGDYRGANVDPIADMLIFNPLGFLLFSSEFGKRFFSETLPVYDWSGVPYFNPGNSFMENAGQQYAVQKPLTAGRRWEAFAYMGVQSVFGVGLRRTDEQALSVGVGSVTYGLIYHDNDGSRIVTPKMKSAVGMFWDRSHSLMASAVISTDLSYLRLEAFPGAVSWKKLKPGCYLARLPEQGVQIGISVSFSPLGWVGNMNR